MDLSLNIFTFFVGLLLLIYAANWLIHGCVKLSQIFKLAPLFIGVVLIGFGTSIPEAGVGVMSAVRNQKDIALGTVIGSNIANIGLILGLCAFFRPLAVTNKNIFKRELPIMLLSVILLYILSVDLVISRLDGLIFIFSFVVFCFISYKGAEISYDSKETEGFRFKKVFQNITSPFRIFLISILAILGVALGADLMVRGGVNLAKLLGISPWIIGITVFAIGTSLPELVASLTALFKKVPSLSIGNIVGSNIFNILFILGIVSLIRPIELQDSILRFELPTLFIFSLMLFTVMKTEYKMTRWEGLILFLGYIGFIALLFVR